MDNNLIPQHKRLAMGLPVNNAPAGSNYNTVNKVGKDGKQAKITPKVEKPRSK